MNGKNDMLKDKLDIIIITYNRIKYLKQTCERILDVASPIKDFSITVIDNNSNDGTDKYAESLSAVHKNIHYIKNKYNVGLSGNIIKAFEAANKDYIWFLGDDDIYYFSHWTSVETAVNNCEKIICVSRYALPDDKKNDIAYQLLQLTFITGCIYSRELINDTIIRSMHDNTYTLFPHILPIISYINQGGKIYVTDHAISNNGMKLEEKDVSYIRGVTDISDLPDRTKDMTWILGYCNTINMLDDKELISDCIKAAISYPDIYPDKNNFFAYLFYLENNKKNYFYEIIPLLSEEFKNEYNKYVLTQITWKNKVSKTGKEFTALQTLWLFCYKLKNLIKGKL